MHFTHLTLAGLAAFAPIAQALGSAKVTNKCQNSVYLWSVGSSAGDVQTIAPGGTYSEVYRDDNGSGGISLKITREKDGLYNGSPQTIFAYSLDGNNIWYDLSDVFGDAFQGSKVGSEFFFFFQKKKKRKRKSETRRLLIAFDSSPSTQATILAQALRGQTA
jgi:hypothetical protein